MKIKVTGVFMPPLTPLQVAKMLPQKKKSVLQVAKMLLVKVRINDLQRLPSGKYTPHLLLPCIGHYFKQEKEIL